MDINEIKRDFKKRYNRDTDLLKTYAVCSDLTVTGHGFERSTKEFYSLPLSVRTYVTLFSNESSEFSFQFSDSATEYTSSVKSLISYKENDFERDIFSAIAHSHGSVKGGEILFSCDVSDRAFKNFTSGVYTAFSIYNSGKVSREVGVYADNENEGKNIPCLLWGRKNYIISSDNTKDFEYIPFNLSGYKVIIASAGLKDEHIEKKLQPYLSKNNYNDISDTAVTERINDSYEKYIINETKRLDNITNILKSGGHLSDIFVQMKSSAYEYADICSKNGFELKRLLNACDMCSLCEGFVPAVKFGGIAVFVKDENVDEFISVFSHSGERESGAKIRFFIASSENSGIEMTKNSV